MQRYLLIVSSLLFSSNIMATPELKGAPEELRQFLHPQEKTMSVSASAEKTAYTDLAIVSVVVKTEEKLLSNAIAKNSELRERLTMSLVAQGLDKTKIKSSEFSSSPQYGWFGDKPKSYSVVNRMAIRIEDGKSLEAISKLADQYQEVDIGSTMFKHSKEDELSLAVKQHAMEKILKQKAFYEQTLSVDLIAVNVYENWAKQDGTAGAENIERIVVTGNRVRSDSFRESYQSKAPAPQSFDEIVYSAKLTVEFEVQRKK